MNSNEKGLIASALELKESSGFWFLQLGPVYNIGSISHAEYVRNNPSLFKISPDELNDILQKSAEKEDLEDRILSFVLEKDWFRIRISGGTIIVTVWRSDHYLETLLFRFGQMLFEDGVPLDTRILVERYQPGRSSNYSVLLKDLLVIGYVSLYFQKLSAYDSIQEKAKQIEVTAEEIDISPFFLHYFKYMDGLEQAIYYFTHPLLMPVNDEDDLKEFSEKLINLSTYRNCAINIFQATLKEQEKNNKKLNIQLTDALVESLSYKYKFTVEYRDKFAESGRLSEALGAIDREIGYIQKDAVIFRDGLNTLANGVKDYTEDFKLGGGHENRNV